MKQLKTAAEIRANRPDVTEEHYARAREQLLAELRLHQLRERRGVGQARARQRDAVLPPRSGA